MSTYTYDLSVYYQLWLDWYRDRGYYRDAVTIDEFYSEIRDMIGYEMEMRERQEFLLDVSLPVDSICGLDATAQGDLYYCEPSPTYISCQ